MAATTMNTEQARFNMIEQQIRPWEVLDPGVLSLLSVVRREEYVPEAQRDLAFADVELPLGHGQTMLAPRVEARILQDLAIKNTDKVLEIGTGSGYMAALIAAKAEFVYSVEIVPELVEFARANLKRAGVANVSVDLGDGACGWPLYAPYDVIVLSGSTPVLPEAIQQQLRVGGRLVAIVGEAPAMQVKLITRTGEDAYTSLTVFETVAAPLVNAQARPAFVF